MSKEILTLDELKVALEQCLNQADELFLSLVAVRLSEAMDSLDAELTKRDLPTNN